MQVLISLFSCLRAFTVVNTAFSCKKTQWLLYYSPSQILRFWACGGNSFIEYDLLDFACYNLPIVLAY